MPAHALPSILPAMTVVDALEVIKIYSVRGLVDRWLATPLARRVRTNQL
jgi:predicted ATPase with chaperone activity